ncbi:GNAT family N-acetyltransferase [Teredinibacter turnerae]|uniref:GNAT family N-acetyltransferase n=1 Tax=Teredinibacter turnerae TaxID=2426 RepID=UPI00037E1449|nr:GNAT family N-acetyltransferase [Teredinibacter turnerae]
MTHELETERLILSQLTIKDFNNFENLITNSDVIRYCFDPLSPAEVWDSFESRIKAWDTRQSQWLALSVHQKGSNEFVGVTGFRNTSNQKEIEVGFMFLPKYQGKGFATESLKAALSYAVFLGYETVVANVTEPNVSSAKVLEKCGFKQSGNHAKGIIISGSVYTSLSYLFKKRTIT